MEEANVNFLYHIEHVKDPRLERTKLHGMFEIILLTFFGVVSDCQGWIAIEDYGKSHLNLLRRYLPFKNGIPSDDTLRRFFRAIGPEQLNKCFYSWMKSVVKQEHLEGRVLALDGKTSRGSADASQPTLHLISAYVKDLRLVLCQVKVDEKTNEITAIPSLLDLLDIRGAIISIDAMGIQKTIAQKIQETGSDYILALKKNQPQIYEDVEAFFTLEKKNNYKDVSVDTFTTREKSHGRIEKRTCIIAVAGKFVSTKEDWSGLKSIVCVESEREIKRNSLLYYKP